MSACVLVNIGNLFVEFNLTANLKTRSAFHDGVLGHNLTYV